MKQKIWTPCKCISENDGLRIITGKSVHFIKKVPSELNQIIGNENTPTKKLVKVYNGSITKEGNSEIEIYTTIYIKLGSIRLKVS